VAVCAAAAPQIRIEEVETAARSERRSVITRIRFIDLLPSFLAQSKLSLFKALGGIKPSRPLRSRSEAMTLGGKVKAKLSRIRWFLVRLGASPFLETAIVVIGSNVFRQLLVEPTAARSNYASASSPK
jgi:hypothetical protein